MINLSTPTQLEKYTDMNADLAPQARFLDNEVAEHFCEMSQREAAFAYGYFRSDPSRMPEFLQDILTHTWETGSNIIEFQWPNLPELSLNVYDGTGEFYILVNGERQPDWATALKLCHWDASADTRGTSRAWQERAAFELHTWEVYHDNA